MADLQVFRNRQHVYDRSRVVTDWNCPRKRELQYEHRGRGIVKAFTSLELFTGTTIHDALATIATLTQKGKPIDIDKLAQDVFNQMYECLIAASRGEIESEEFATEQATLVEGMIRGFYKHAWPRLMAQYPKILYVEQEVEYRHDGHIFMSKPDLIAADPTTDEAVYIEYKSTKSKREEWVNSWDTAVQLHSTVRAVEATTGTSVQQVIVQGLYKGYESYGKQSSPFCYAYKRNGNPPFTKDEVAYEYKPGYKRYPTWQLEGGVKQWVDSMPVDVLANQFPQTPPIYVNDDLIDAFFRQRATRETEIRIAKELLADPDVPEDAKRIILDQAFPQRFDQCVPGYGRPCEFRKICHGNVSDPLTEGFQWRDPHHQKELDLFNESTHE